MNVLAEASPNDVFEVYKNMGKAQISSENMDFMLEMMRKLELDKKLKEEGRQEGKEEGEREKEISIVKKLLSMGMDTEFISRAVGLNAGKIEEIKRNLIND